MNPRLLIVEDDEEIRTQLKWALSREYDIALAEDKAQALTLAKEFNPKLVLLDLGLPPHPNDPTEGLATLSDLLLLNPALKVIIVSGQGERGNALQGVGRGAYDFLTKPVNVDELAYALKRALYLQDLEHEYRELQRDGGSSFEGMLGSSVKMQDVFTRIRKVAPSDASVLILGESGTGKEMVARAIHQQSARKDQPFVAINCGAIPDNLLESELFGYEKGAFTGAVTQKPGRIERAAGGTLFLDEIGELSPTLQVKLLRFLQEQQFERVGGTKEIEIDVRVVAATNIDLTDAMSKGTFREDLYYRLAVVVVKLPPLRERQGDIAMLANAFLQRIAAANGKKNLRFHDQALRLIEQYHWPGNVRELENRVNRGVIMADGSRVMPSDMELVLSKSGGRTLKEVREEAETELIQDAMRRHAGKISAVATELGISRPTLYELMEKLGLKKAAEEEA